MLVDVSRQLVFPLEIATTTVRLNMVLCSPALRKFIVIEITVTWEDTVDESYLKQLRYA